MKIYPDPLNNPNSDPRITQQQYEEWKREQEEIEEIKGRYVDRTKQYNSSLQMWDDIQTLLSSLEKRQEEIERLKDICLNCGLAISHGQRIGNTIISPCPVFAKKEAK